MKSIFKYLMLCLLGGSLLSCANDDFQNEPEFDFAYIDILDSDTSGWVGGFADYPDSLKGKLKFNVEYTQLNNVFQSDNKVLRLSADNPHKDLFYYITKKFKGLKANTRYEIGATFEVQSAMLTDTTGSYPLELYFKLGGSNIMPDTVFDIGSSSSKYKLNLNKGENDTVGSDFIYLGKPDADLKISKSSPQIIRNGDISVTKTVETNSEGELWATLGIDSKIEWEMAFSFNTIVVYFREL